MAVVSPEELNLRRIAESLNRQTRRRFGEVTLDADADFTTVEDPTVTEESGIILVARTAAAKAEEHTDPYCLVTPARGSFTIDHTNAPDTDRTFFWLAAGG
jgi:hypothetical protein